MSSPAHPWDRRLGFWWIAEDHPDAAAVLAGPDGPRTYGELAGDAHQLVHLFRALGAEPETGPVAVMADNGTTILEVVLAGQESGLHVIPLNTHLTAGELGQILDHSGCRVLVVQDRLAPLVDALDGAGARPDLTVLTIGAVAGRTSLAEARACHPRTPPPDRSPGGLFVYTSGTTGTPKGIRRPLASGEVGEVAHAAALFGRAFDFRPFEGPMLVSTGLFHGGSLAFSLGGLNVGHALVIMDRFDAERALALIEEHGIRTGYMVPTQLHRFLQLPERTRGTYDVSSLHAIVHSAAPCPRPVKERIMAWWGPVVWETYGGMEGAATIAKPDAWLARPGTVGRAVRGVRLVVLDEDGTELGPGEVGDIYIDNGVGFHYHDDPEQTAAAHRGDRLFSLGDVGHLDDDGYLFIADRSKDMIITGGTNVYPAEVEAALLDHPDVDDVAVVGLPDPDWGETVAAVVQPAAGAVAEGLEATLVAHCRACLASFKVPRRWLFRDDLARTEAGKLPKARWRAEMAEIAETERLADRRV